MLDVGQPVVTMRFSPRFLNVFFRLPRLPSSLVWRFPEPLRLAIFYSFAESFQLQATSCLAHALWRELGAGSWQFLDHFLLRNRALARPFRVRALVPRALTVHRQPAAMAHPAVQPDFHSRLMFIEISCEDLLRRHPALR